MTVAVAVAANLLTAVAKSSRWPGRLPAQARP
jgi:hypothetical protein